MEDRIIIGTCKGIGNWYETRKLNRYAAMHGVRYVFGVVDLPANQSRPKHNTTHVQWLAVHCVNG